MKNRSETPDFKHQLSADEEKIVIKVNEHNASMLLDCLSNKETKYSEKTTTLQINKVKNRDIRSVACGFVPYMLVTLPWSPPKISKLRLEKIRERMGQQGITIAGNFFTREQLTIINSKPNGSLNSQLTKTNYN